MIPVVLCVGLLASAPFAREVPRAEPAAEEGAASAPEWAVAASIYTYLVPGEDNYGQPTVAAERGPLHLEARYNYEDRGTTSFWAGYAFTFGDRAEFDIAPMLGAVFGDSRGVAPGYRAALGWRRLELYSEGEYVFSTVDRSESFFYSWSTLMVSVVEWLEVGIVGQRTRAYESEREIQRGLAVGVIVRNVSFTGHVFDPDTGEPTYVMAIELDL